MTLFWKSSFSLRCAVWLFTTGPWTKIVAYIGYFYLIYYFADDTISALSVTRNAPTAFHLSQHISYLEGMNEFPHHGAELPWAGECGGNVPKFLNVFISLEHYLLCVQQRLCRPCIIHVCIVTTCRGTQHCTSFLLFNFEFLMLVSAQAFYRILWMYVNIQARTSLHPGNTQRLFWWFIVFNPKCVHNISVHMDILYIFPLFYPRCIYK